MDDVVVVVVDLDARVLDVVDLDLAGEVVGDRLGDLVDRHRLGHLVEDAELAAVGRVLAGQPDALDGVDDVDQAAGLGSVAVDGERVAEHGLDDHPVEHGAEHAVVVEAGGQAVVELGLLGIGAVDDALVEVGRAQAPDPAAELDVVAVVHLRAVVEGAGLLGVDHPVLAALVLDLDPALLDVDVGLAVLAHRAELDQVDVAIDVGDRVHHVEVADDVVGLRVDRVRLVDHRVRRCALLAEVDDRLGAEVAHHLVHELGVAEVADVGLDRLAADLAPGGHALLERADRDQALDAHLHVVAASREVVVDGDVVPERGQMQGGRPPEVPVTAKNQDLHGRSKCLQTFDWIFSALDPPGGLEIGKG